MADATPTGAPRASAWRIARELAPSWWGCGFSLVASVVLAAGLLLALLTGGFGGGDAQAVRDSGPGMLMLAVVAVPVVALLGALAAATSPRAGGRALVLMGVSFALLIGNLSCGRALVAFDGPPPVAWIWSSATYGGLAVLLGAAALLTLSQTPERLRETLEREQRAWVGEVVGERGGVSLDELLQQLEIPEAELREHLVELLAGGELQVRIEERDRRVYSAERVKQQQQRAAALLEERGRTDLAELASELDEPRRVLEGWIGELLMARRIVGTIDRDRGLFLWDPHGDGAIGQRAFEQRDCERCGGALLAVGRGLFRCVYCGVERDAEAA